MSRIASFAANQNMISYLLRSQQQMNLTNTQVSSGKVSQNYMGISTSAQLLLSYENKSTLLERYRADNETADFRLETSGVTLESLESTFTDIRKILRDFEAENPDAQTTEYIQSWAFRSLVDIETYLNSEADGRYMFSGSKVHDRPVDLGLSTLEAFQAQYDGYHVTYPTTRDAHLARFALSEDPNNVSSGPFVDANNWMSFFQDNDGDQFSSGSGTIQAPSSMFGNVEVGSVINVSGTTGGTNDGAYTVSAVSGDTVTVNTVMLTDETAKSSFATESLVDPHGATVTTGGGTVLTTAETGNLDVNGTAGTLTAATAGAFASISIGDHIQLAGSAANDGTYEVLNVAGDVLTLGTNSAVTFDLADGSTLTQASTGDLSFNRAADTITSATVNAFSGVNVGDLITVSGSGQNDGTYAVTANDGTTLTVETNKITNQGVSTGSTFYDYPAGGQVVFDTAGSTISAQDYTGASISGVFSDYQVGDSITVGNASVPATLYTQIAFTNVGAAGTDTIQIQDNGGGAVTGAFDGAQVGDSITIAGYGAYTVNWVSNDGSTIRVDEDILANSVDSAVSRAISGANIDNFTTQTNLAFAAGGNTITLQDTTAATVTNEFADMSVGMEVTIAGATTAGNDGTYRITGVAGGVLTVENLDGSAVTFTGETSNAATTISAAGNDGTYTISAVASDGSSVTIDASTPLVADQTVTNGATLTSAARGLSHTAGTRLLINDAADTIQIVNAKTGAAVSDAVSGLAAGMTIELAGTALNDGLYTIGSVDSATGTITLAASTPISGGDENFTPSSAAGGTGSLRVYGTAGSITSQTDYYQGDEVAIGHRVESGRDLFTDINAIDPAFERAIRALSIIAQGEYGTAGGLDQNIQRVEDAIYLLDLTLGDDRVSPPPYGSELSGDVRSLQQDVAFNRLVIQRTIERQTSTIDSLLGLAGSIEDADPLETITKLLSQQTSIEASYQAISRVNTLSLSDYLPL